MGEGLIAAAFTFVGFGVAAWFGAGITPATRIWLSYPLGAAAWVGLTTLFLVLRIPLLPIVVLAVLAAAAAASLIVERRQGRWTLRSTGLPLVAAVTLVTLFAVMLAEANLSAMTNDSFWILRQARTLLHAGGLGGPPDYLVLRSFPVAVALLQLPAEMIGRDYLASQATVLTVSGIGALISLAQMGVRSVGTRDTNRWTVFIAGTVFLATSFFVVFQAFYIRGNLESGVYTALAIISVWLGAVTGHPRWAAPAGLAMVPAILLRVESPLFLIPFLVLAVCSVSVPNRIRVVLVSVYGAVALGWYGAVLLPYGEGNILDGLSTSVIVLTAPALLLTYVLARSSGRLGSLLRARAASLTIGLLILLAATVTLWKPAWMAQAFANIARNTFEPAQGLWGVAWIVLVPLFLFAIWYRRLPHASLFTVWIGGYFLMLYVSGAFFILPHKLGWLSSANRMLSVVLLPMWIFVLMHFTVEAPQDPASDPAEASDPDVRTLYG